MEPALKRMRSSRHQLILLVPGEVVSLLIGKGGSTIKEMEAHSGATISFAKEDEVMMGEVLRTVTIYSDSMEANTAAQDLITRNLQVLKPEPSAGNKCKLRMLVQNQLVGSLIGVQGRGIKSITEESHSYVSFCKEHEMPPGSQFRAVTLLGEPEQIIVAQQRITEHHESLLQDLLGGCAPTLPAERLVHRGAAMLTPPPAPVRSGAGAPVSSTRAPVVTPPAASIAWPAAVARPPPAACPSPAVIAPAPHVRVAASGGLPAASPTLNLTLWIPNSRVGLFIGTRGANIKRITDSTHAWISVQKEDAVATVDSISGVEPMRPVLFRGPMEDVLQAQGMAMAMLLEIDPQVAFTVVASSDPTAGQLEEQELSAPQPGSNGYS